MKRLILAALLLPASISAVELQLTASLPCYEPSYNDSAGCYEDSAGVVERTLDSLLIYGWRFPDADTVRLGAVSIRGEDCMTHSFSVEAPSGTMGEIQVWLKDRGGNVGCRPFRYVFALPAVDSTSAAVVGQFYDLVWRKPK